MRLEKFIKEQELALPTGVRNIYFGHSRLFYDTKDEIKAMQIIRKFFPDSNIENPNSPAHTKALVNYPKKSGAEMKYFVQLVDKADAGCFLVKNIKKWTMGSAIEAFRFLWAKKPVFIINLAKKTLTHIKNRKDIKKMSIKDTDRQLKKQGLSSLIQEIEDLYIRTDNGENVFEGIE